MMRFKIKSPNGNRAPAPVTTPVKSLQVYRLRFPSISEEQPNRANTPARHDERSAHNEQFVSPSVRVTVIWRLAPILETASPAATSGPVSGLRRPDFRRIERHAAVHSVPGASTPTSSTRLQVVLAVPRSGRSSTGFRVSALPQLATAIRSACRLVDLPTAHRQRHSWSEVLTPDRSGATTWRCSGESPDRRRYRIRSRQLGAPSLAPPPDPRLRPGGGDRRSGGETS